MLYTSCCKKQNCSATKEKLGINTMNKEYLSSKQKQKKGEKSAKSNEEIIKRPDILFAKYKILPCQSSFYEKETRFALKNFFNRIQ